MPGLIHWHAPLALLTPGLWALLAALALALLPSGAWRRSVTVLVTALALILALLALRAAWRGEAAVAQRLDGLVRVGWLQVALALTAALCAGGRFWTGLMRSGGAWLLVLWSLPLGALAAWPTLPRRQWPAIGVALLASLILVPVLPVLAALPVTGALAVVLPHWRAPAAAVLVAVIMQMCKSQAGPC